jgi:hypothetical protein
MHFERFWGFSLAVEIIELFKSSDLSLKKLAKPCWIIIWTHFGVNLVWQPEQKLIQIGYTS